MAYVRQNRPAIRLSDEDRARAIGTLEAGINPQDVADQFNVHRSTIVRLRQRYQETGTVSDRPKPGRPRATTRGEDRYMYTSDRSTTTLC